MICWIGIDDTDKQEESGTGRLARQVAAELREYGRVRGVSRHQLLKDPAVPYTSNNSCNVIHFDTEMGPGDLVSLVSPMVQSRALPGSDPGVCVGNGSAANHPFGRAAQTRVVTQAEAQSVARELGLILEALGGTGDGIIGSAAGVILAAGGNDGRFVELGRSRELTGVLSIEELHSAGIEEVRSADGVPRETGLVETYGRVRPILIGHQAVLMVRQMDEGCFAIVEQGKPKHRESEERSCAQP